MSPAEREQSIIEEVLAFWFAPAHQPLWFRSTFEFDQIIKTRFERLWLQLQREDLKLWKQSAHGYLALAIVFDQFPLNMYRGQPRAFSTESQAVHIANAAIAKKQDDLLNDQEVVFLYMPLMHSESLTDQDRSVQLFAKRKLQSNLRFAQHHRDLIRRFGRFPHRNTILGRVSTPEELAYLASKDAFLG